MLVTILRSSRLHRGRSNDKCVVTGNVLKRQRSDASSLYYYIYVAYSRYCGLLLAWQLKSCQLPRNSAETTYTTSPDQIDGMKLEI